MFQKCILIALPQKDRVAGFVYLNLSDLPTAIHLILTINLSLVNPLWD